MEEWITIYCGLLKFDKKNAQYVHRGVPVEKGVLEKKIDNLLEDLKSYVEVQSLSENDIVILRAELDKLLYECLYYKSKIVSWVLVTFQIYLVLFIKSLSNLE